MHVPAGRMAWRWEDIHTVYRQHYGWFDCSNSRISRCTSGERGKRANQCSRLVASWASAFRVGSIQLPSEWHHYTLARYLVVQRTCWLERTRGKADKVEKSGVEASAKLYVQIILWKYCKWESKNTCKE